MRRSDTHTTGLIMTHPRSGHVRPEHQPVRPVEAQVQRDRPRDRRDGRLAARHDVRVATHQSVLRRGPRVVHVEACVEIKILRRVLNRRVDLHAIDAATAR